MTIPDLLATIGTLNKGQRRTIHVHAKHRRAVWDIVVEATRTEAARR